MTEDELIKMRNEEIKFEYETLKFSVPFIVYRLMNVWVYFDTIALYFYLVSFLVTMVLGT